MNLDGLDRTTNQIEIRSKVKVPCPKCQTEGKKSKVILYPGQTIPKMKYTDGYWNQNGNFIEFNEEIKVPSYICSNGHITACDPMTDELVGNRVYGPRTKNCS